MSDTGMELQEFITSTLCRIIRGVKDAQEDLLDTNAEIQPVHISKFSDDKLGVPFKQGRGLVSNIDFDIALTVSEETEVGSRIGVIIGSLGASAEGRGKDEFSSAHRVKFSVPVLFTGEEYN